MKYCTMTFFLMLCLSCGESKKEKQLTEEPDTEKVRLMTLDPGHFHAALVQKTMYPEVDSTMYVFAPEGPEVKDFLSKIEAYNSRADSPTDWQVETFLGDGYLKKMIADKPGNVMIVAGKNSKKIDYILAAVKAGINVYADKPLVINPEGYQKLEEAFKVAKENGVLIYDIMTERFEVTTDVQRLLSASPKVFGEVIDGSQETPAISKESVHHFFKYVSGEPLVRPAWFFDINEEGEGMVDVTTHLVDLVQWELFPEQIINQSDIEMVSAKRWSTDLTLEEFSKVTGLDTFPDYLKKDLVGDKLKVYCNGEMIYKIRGKYAKVSVIWNYQAPQGTGDTHYSIMRGTKSDLIIKQGAEEDYKPTLYVSLKDKGNLEAGINAALQGDIAKIYPGITAEKVNNLLFKIHIPEKYKIGHEAHFAQVTQNYLRYLKQGQLPNWEEPNMLTKYYTTIEGYKMAKKE
ncbi:MAG: putative oxidoreductase C-terminal domain-containing protein [Arenibacter sp.]|nr:putative oxidoreductase C-terminal domain-containing protein [Arenibacter sp.]